MTLNELENEWLEKYQKDHIKRQTYIKYKMLYDNYIKNELGNNEIIDFTKRQIQEFINKLKETKGQRTNRLLSPSTINSTLTVLKMIFNYAIDFDLLITNPTNRVRGITKSEANIIKCFTIDEQKKIEGYCYNKGNIMFYGFILDLYTGLRIGELLSLEWKDIDFRSGILNVNKTVYLSKDDNGIWKEFIDTPKTKSSKREIPLPKHILLSLKKFKKEKKSKTIISRDNGEKVTAKLYTYHYYHMLKVLKIRKLSFHTLRHTFATRALESGMDVKTLSDILGHSNASITLNIYTHSLTKHKRKMMNNIRQLVHKK